MQGILISEENGSCVTSVGFKSTVPRCRACREHKRAARQETYDDVVVEEVAKVPVIHR